MAMRGMGLGAVMVVAAGLAACAPPQPPKLDVEAQWREAISNLGMFALYPPSEDVMVGDAFLYLPNSALFDMVRVTSAPLKPLAMQFCYQEKDRMVLDTLKDGKDGRVRAAHDECLPPRGPNKLQQIPQRIAAHDSQTTAMHITRLREEAIPRLEVGRFSEGELAVAGLLGNFGAALGIGASGAAAVRVELGGLQSATLEELRGSRLLEEIAVSRVRRVRSRTDDYPNALTPLMLARSLRLADQRNGSDHFARLCRGDFATLEERGVRVVVANRVLYAGSVTFDFMREQVSTARLALDFASTLAGMPQKPVVPALPGAQTQPQGSGASSGSSSSGGSGSGSSSGSGQSGSGGRKPVTPPEFDFEAQRAAMLATANRLMTLKADKAGQASGRLTTGSFGNLAMYREFVRPAAVGMGAALQFPVREALLPAGADQVNEALVFCRATEGTASPVLEDVLWRNLAWSFYLELRDKDGQRAALEPEDAFGRALQLASILRGKPVGGAVEPRSARMPALVPSASVRVRP